MSEIRMMLNYPDFTPEEPKTDKLGLPEGMVDYDLRVAIRNYKRVYEFDATRQRVAELLDELSGRRLS
jgi:hypothetical protein